MQKKKLQTICSKLRQPIYQERTRILWFCETKKTEKNFFGNTKPDKGQTTKTICFAEVLTLTQCETSQGVLHKAELKFKAFLFPGTKSKSMMKKFKKWKQEGKVEATTGINKQKSP